MMLGDGTTIYDSNYNNQTSKHQLPDKSTKPKKKLLRTKIQTSIKFPKREITPMINKDRLNRGESRNLKSNLFESNNIKRRMGIASQQHNYSGITVAENGKSPSVSFNPRTKKVSLNQPIRIQNHLKQRTAMQADEETSQTQLSNGTTQMVRNSQNQIYGKVKFRFPDHKPPAH